MLVRGGRGPLCQPQKKGAVKKQAPFWRGRARGRPAPPPIFPSRLLPTGTSHAFPRPPPAVRKTSIFLASSFTSHSRPSRPPIAAPPGPTASCSTARVPSSCLSTPPPRTQVSPSHALKTMAWTRRLALLLTILTVLAVGASGEGRGALMKRRIGPCEDMRWVSFQPLPALAGPPPIPAPPPQCSTQWITAPAVKLGRGRKGALKHTR